MHFNRTWNKIKTKKSRIKEKIDIKIREIFYIIMTQLILKTIYNQKLKTNSTTQIEHL